MGKLFENQIPITIGIPKRIKTVFIISQASILMGITRFDVSEYRLPQMAKFSGVIIIAANVANAVKLTERATFAFANEEIKFEILPPGQAATRIIPIATLGDGLIITISKNVSAGKAINCEITPSKTDFGY